MGNGDLPLATQRNSYFAHSKDRMVQVQTTLVASPRYHRWRSFLLREKFENRARLEVKAFVVVDGKVLNSRIGLYAQRRLDLMRRPLGRPSAPP